MIDNNFNLQSFLSNFHSSNSPKLITNDTGFILEVNQAALDLFKAESPTQIKNKNIITFAHRKSTRTLRSLVGNVSKNDSTESEEIELRPRGQASFPANVEGKIVCRSKMIVLMEWNIKKLHATVVSIAHESYPKTGTH